MIDWMHFLNSDGHGLEWQAVPTNDLEVQSAASHAVKSFQQRSNSLFPYELLEILHAKAKVGISHCFAIFVFRLVLYATLDS